MASEGGFRLLVCGGRDYANREGVFATLDRVHRLRTIVTIIHGAARGADSLAGEWARARGVEEVPVPADWRQHGRRAGPIRNQRMLDEHRPSAVVAFPGGAGTADMTLRAERAGLGIFYAAPPAPAAQGAPPETEP